MRYALLAILLLLAFPALAQQTPISALPGASPLQANDLFPLDQRIGNTTTPSHVTTSILFNQGITLTIGTTSNIIFQTIASTVDSICSVAGMPNICTSFFGYASPRWYGGFCGSNFNTNNNFQDDAAGILAAAGNPNNAPVLIPAPGCKIASQITYNHKGIVLFTFAHSTVYNGTITFGQGPIKPYLYLPDVLTSTNAIETNGFDSNGFFNLAVNGASGNGVKGASFVNHTQGNQGGSAQFSDFETVSCADVGTCLGYATGITPGSTLCVPNTPGSNDNVQWWIHDLHVGQSCFGIAANATDNIVQMAGFSDIFQNCIGSVNGSEGFNGDVNGVRCEYAGFSADPSNNIIPNGNASGIYYNSNIGLDMANISFDHVTGPAIDIGPSGARFALSTGFANNSRCGIASACAQVNIEAGARSIYINNFDLTETAIKYGYQVGNNVDYLQIIGGDTISSGTQSLFNWAGSAPAHMNIQVLGSPFLMNGQAVGVGIGTGIPSSSVDYGGNTDAITLQKGTTAQRPVAPINGMLRYNTTTTTIEGYIASAWSLLQSRLVSAFALAAGETPLIIEAFGDTTLGNSIQAYYKLDDASGSTAVESVAAANGTWNGTLGSQWGTGIVNGDGVFNGTDNYVSTTFTGVTSNAARTLSFWMKSSTPSCGANTGIAGVTIASYSNFNVVTCVGSHVNGIGFIFGGFQYVYWGANSLYNGQWHHVVITTPAGATGNTLLAYQDGLPLSVISSFNPSSSLGTGSGTIQLSGSSTNLFYTGQIDEVGFWNRQLSQAEVTALYNNGLANQYPFLQQTAPIVSITDAAGNVFDTVGPTGNVGIGTSTPLSKLSITGLGTSAPLGTSGAGYMCMDAGGNSYGPKVSCP